MTAAQRKLLLLGLIPVLAVVLGGGAITLSTIRGKVDYDFSSEYRQPIELVTVVSDVPLDIEPSTDGKVHLQVSGTYTDDPPRTDAGTVDGKELKIGVSCRRSGCEISATVQLPSATSLSVTTSLTSLDLRDLSGRVDLHADNGSVDGVRLKSEQVTASVVDGSLDLAFVRGASAVDASTSNGSLHLEVPGTAAYSIDAAASGGSTTLGVANDPSAPNTLKLRTTNGSLTVDPA
ncbi:DUF4097 family beta strand repeat-containing protein [Kribbella sp. NPDC051718]|uniref:DUF4097 family beta strand repeat-containing protein n=1 Tax=Kribbella sp. NPDC051718 TaxID=3155168 RepID=UPI00341D990B